MIVQRAGDQLRVVTQHAHGLIAGQLARSLNVSYDLVLACALHDVAWRHEDEAPLFDADRGRFFDFMTYPGKQRFYTQGITDLETLAGPVVASLCSLHFATLQDDETFTAQEKRRRERLGGDPDGLDTLRFFDTLSLYVCMTHPTVDEHPPWLRDRLEMGGLAVDLKWLDDGRLSVHPFFSCDQLRIPVRFLPQTRYVDRDAALAALRAARYDTCTVDIVPR